VSVSFVRQASKLAVGETLVERMRNEALATECDFWPLSDWRLVTCLIHWVAQSIEVTNMCRNIKILFNFAPPVTEEEIRAASLQFVRKVSGFNKPSKANEAAFLAAVERITAISSTLLNSLKTSAPPRYREVEAAKARERSAQRFLR
jgi:hypothetical protein